MKHIHTLLMTSLLSTSALAAEPVEPVVPVPEAHRTILGLSVMPLLIGRDPARIEDTWQYLYQGAYWRRGPVTMSAIAAVDTALWDIKGKVAGLPVYQLLGGRSRDGVTVYGHANGDAVDDVLTEVRRYVELGYRAVRVQTGVPGLEKTYGVSKDKLFYEPADAALPTETSWSTARYLQHVPGVFERVLEPGRVDTVSLRVPLACREEDPTQTPPVVTVGLSTPGSLAAQVVADPTGRLSRTGGLCTAADDVLPGGWSTPLKGTVVSRTPRALTLAAGMTVVPSFSWGSP